MAEAGKWYFTVKCKVLGCGQSIVVAEAPPPPEKMELPSEPFEDVCPFCTWFQRFQPADIIRQEGKDFQHTMSPYNVAALFRP
jgi:hypothetical protein